MSRTLFRRWVLPLAAILLSACKHDWRDADEFAARIRCGMSPSEIQTLGSQYDVAKDRIWQYPSTNVLVIKPRELDFIHVLMEGGEAVAVQRGNHVAFTTGMEFGSIRMLCGATQIPDRTFGDYEDRTSSGH